MRAAEPAAVRRLLKQKGQQAFLDLALRYGKTYRHQRAIITCEPELVRALLMDRANTQQRPRTYKLMGKLPGADGILFKDGEAWRTRVRALAPVFHRNCVDTFPTVLHDMAAAHARRWQENGGGVDLYGAILDLGAESVLAMGYGLDPADTNANRLARALVAYKQFTMGSDTRRRLDRFDSGIARWLALPWAVAGIFTMWRKMKDVRAALESVLSADAETSGRFGWVKLLRKAGLPPSQLANEINHLYGAFNAIDYIVTAALVELARSRKWTERLRGELTSVLGSERAPTRTDLQQLPQTNAFMLEVLRRYPVSMGVVRRAGTDLQVAGERISSDSEVMISLYALHHHPEFWGDDALEMKPERWLSSTSPAVAYSYVPFLEGPRKCIGRHMAQLQFVAVLAAVIRRFDLRLLAEPTLPPFLIPRFGAPIPFEMRQIS